MLDVSTEAKLQTARSGGKGGQNVNKVETAVIAYFNIGASALLSEGQKELIRHKLANRINTRDELVVKAQTHRTQLENKEEVLKKINEAIHKALQKKKARIATRPSRGAREARIEEKKKKSDTKRGRQKFRPGQY